MAADRRPPVPGSRETTVPFDILDLKSCAVISPQTASRQTDRHTSPASQFTARQPSCCCCSFVSCNRRLAQQQASALCLSASSALPCHAFGQPMATARTVLRPVAMARSFFNRRRRRRHRHRHITIIFMIICIFIFIIFIIMAVAGTCASACVTVRSFISSSRAASPSCSSG